MRRFAGLARMPALVIFTALVVLSVARVSAQESGSPMILPVDPAPLVVETDAGAKSFAVEIADEPEERRRGLMFRERLPESQGMLFVFEQTQPLGFWMMNTILPLDLLFISEDGEVRAILQGEPYSTDTISPGPDEPGRFVLELNAGTAEAQGIEVGDRLTHPVIQAAGGN
ncbi:DUF192 domain-containing protein [Aquibium sp. LZ166]|uniref:DUF192 domain-containing protein n=1 Tax=Aquibium pacificus TaxID=3153579 RepID=A0ABV3SIR2_9HYPH